MSRRPLALLVLTLAVALLGHGGWIHAKSALGQWLMARAWDDAARSGTAPAEPWPGARTRPVARLVVPDLKIDRLVMEGIELPKLAWGPGLAEGENGHRVIAAHRDTHFRFLGDLAPGQALEFEHVGGVIDHWRVQDSRVIDSRETQLDLDAAGPLLTLVTCYPLDGTAPGTPYRLVVQATPSTPFEPSPEAVAWAP